MADPLPNDLRSFAFPQEIEHIGGLTKRELFAVFGDQPGVAEIVTAAGFHSPDGFSVWRDKETKIGTFTDWWSKLSNRERFALSSKVRMEQADALLSALNVAK